MISVTYGYIMILHSVSLHTDFTKQDLGSIYLGGSVEAGLVSDWASKEITE